MIVPQYKGKGERTEYSFCGWKNICRDISGQSP